MKLNKLLGTILLSTTFICLPYYAKADDAAEVAELRAQLKEMSAQMKAMSAKISSLESQQKKTAAKQETINTKVAAINSQSQSANGGAQKTTAPQVTTGKAPTVPGEGQAVVGGSFPGSFKLPGTGTSVKFGGYIKADAIQDINHGYGGRYANFAAIPLDNSVAANQDSQFNAHARQSRINMETRTPTDLGELKTFIEADFFGSATGNANTTNGEGLQLRQAYGQLGKFLAGQTWSNFMDMDAYPESLDYVGPAGLTFVRQTQLRYSETSGKYTFSLAAESPSSDFTSPTTTATKLDDMPDITGKVQLKDSFGQLSVRGLVRHVKVDTSTAVASNSDSAYGYGIGISGKINMFDKDAFFFQGVYGDGIGRYLFDVANSGNGSVYTLANGVETQTAYGGYAAYQHAWSPEWRTNIIAGYTGIDNNVALTGAAVNKEIYSGHVNLIWNPVPSFRTGIEYMHGYREQESGVSGDLDRVQASVMYLF